MPTSDTLDFCEWALEEMDGAAEWVWMEEVLVLVP